MPLSEQGGKLFRKQTITILLIQADELLLSLLGTVASQEC
jgi:hypothetical protein